MTSSTSRNRSRLLKLVVFAVSAAGGCGSGSKAKGDDGGGSAGDSDGGAGTHGAAGVGGAAGGSGPAGSGGHVGGGGTGGGGKGGIGGTGGIGTSLPACPGVDPAPVGQACRTPADCPQFGSCGLTPQPTVCGACLPGPHECSGDGGCSPDKVCIPATDYCHCNFADGPGTVCTNRCTATSCGTFQACDTASGLCKPKTCGPDFACGNGFICAPTRTGADAYGCATASCATDGYACPTAFECKTGAGTNANGCSPVSCVGGAFHCPSNTDCKAGSTWPHNCERRACTSDKTCDCGACIQGSCQDRLFVCSPPPPS